MHFISGGAYNGKANWVKEYYQLANQTSTDYTWISAYKGESLPDDLAIYSDTLMVLEGLEQWILSLVKHHSIDDVHEMLQIMLTKWITWSEQQGHQLVLIGTDLSKGIVPADATLRKWRDVTGFIYQDIAKRSSCFHYVWYGIAQSLK